MEYCCDYGYRLKWPILICISVIQLLIVSPGLAQNGPLDQTVTLKTGDRSIERVLNELLDNGVNLSYSDNAIPLKKRVSIKTPTRTVYQHLITVFNDERVTIEDKGNSILLYRSSKKLRKKVTIRGVVKDFATGENLIGAHVWIDSLGIGTTTNEYGFYSLRVRQGEHIVKSSYLGYEVQSEDVVLRKNLRLNIRLNSRTPRLNEVVISSRTREAFLSEEPTGHHKLDMETFSQIPYFLGEVDILQGALLLPGITNLGEDALGLNVRGGSTDQNLILLDEAPIYNSSHLFGLISIFNPDAVKRTDIFKSSIPTSYGGRAGSVIHVRKREGNDQEYHVTGGTGVASTRLMVEGPLVKNRSSFLVSGRSSFTNFSFFNFNDELSFRQSRASFHDVNMKLNFRINKRNTVYLSGYLGNDRNRIGDDILRRWGNDAVTFRWNSQITPRLFMNSTASFSDYSYRTGNINRGIGEFIGTASNVNYTLKTDLTYYEGPDNSFDFGAGITLHRLDPGNREPAPGNQTFNVIDLDSEHGLEPYIYFTNRQRVSDKVTLNFGVRLSRLLNVGPGEVFEYQQEQTKERETITDTIQYDSREVIKSFSGIEPRLSLNYRVSKSSSFKVSYDRTVQYLHLISNTISPSPTDIWRLSGAHINPQIGNQLALGYYQYFDNGIELTAEVFGRITEDIIDYKDGADLELNESIETELLSGDGRAYGLEISLHKNLNKLNGWINYNLSRSERRIRSDVPGESINDGEYFPNDFDKTHDLSLVGIYELSDRWSVSSNFVYRTGRPITFPEGKYQFESTLIPNFSGRNQNRISDYHRLDLSATFRGRLNNRKGKKRKVEDYWTFSIYNVYARKNAFSYFFRQSEDNPQSTEVIRYAILGTAIPAITYNFKF